MLIETHLIQSFAPANLNRDDTGAPKDCVFGGARRARISSQCLKRSIRREFPQTLAQEVLGKRTRLVVDEVVKRLQSLGEESQVRAVAAAAVEGMGLKVKSFRETKYLLFIGASELDALAELCREHWSELTAVIEPLRPGGDEEDEQKLGKNLPAEFKKLAKKILGRPRAADIALFGRMLADLPAKNIDAACQVAHAISTHRIEMEMDYFTAVDDLQDIASEKGAGAGMIGTISFNSACFYRYADLDYAQLIKNLDGDADLSRSTLEAFLRTSYSAIPTGKQNTFAAHNPPSLYLVGIRDRGQPVSLANAFEKPVRSRSDSGLLLPSLNAFDDYWGRMNRARVLNGMEYFYLCLEDVPFQSLTGEAVVDNLDQLIERSLAAVNERGEA